MNNDRPKIEPADESFDMTFIALMLLLLCFMVIMVSLATIEDPRFKQAIGSVRGAFSVLMYAPSSEMIGNRGAGVLPEKGGTEDPETVEEYIDALAEETIKAERAGDHDLPFTVVESDWGFSITLGSPLLFEAGGASLAGAATPMLEALADLLTVWEGRMEVVGHTCDLPVGSSRYSSNWDLSVARATAVVEFLEKKTEFGDRLLAAGMGSSMPTVANDSDTNRRKNRRVEIRLVLPADDG